MLYNKIFLVDNSLDMNNFIISGGKIVVVSEEINPQLVSSIGALQGTVLLPPFEAVSSLVDGDKNTFKMIYLSYLSAKDQDLFISAIITAAMTGVPIGLMFGTFDNNMNFEIFQTFAEYVANTYGIIIEAMGRPFYAYDTYDAMNLDRIYLYNLIPWNEYLYRYPKNYNLNQDIVAKLIMDSGFRYSIDFNAYVDLFNRMRFNMDTPQLKKVIMKQ